MKIKIGPYRSWFGPYQLAEALCFWVRAVPDKDGIKSKPYWVHSFGDLLAHGQFIPEPKIGEVSSWASEELPQTWLYKFLSWIDSKKTRKVKIHLDRYDTWSMEHTLALIIVPMLKQLQATKHGAPFVDNEDVPEHLRSTAAPAKENEWDTDDNHFKRWDWVLDEMIHAFECELDEDWENQFYSGEHDIQWLKLENGNSEMKRGPNDTWSVDREAMIKAMDRRNNGRRLFAKYYHNLWD
jgi:hypothetical protein